VNTLDDLFEDEHLRAVDFFELSEDAEGNMIRAARSPAQFSQSGPVHLSDAPHLGQHTEEVLREAGVSAT
jgi:crotonobetainyl-CoA:carnitine CoA-transferase CaiB-like acyl-CoA transferase